MGGPTSAQGTTNEKASADRRFAAAPALAQTVQEQTTVVTKRPNGGTATGAMARAAGGALVAGPDGHRVVVDAKTREVVAVY